MNFYRKIVAVICILGQLLIVDTAIGDIDIGTHSVKPCFDLHYDISDSIQSTIYNIEKIKFYNNIFYTYIDYLPNGYPCDFFPVTSRYGYREDPIVNNKTLYHYGIDIALPVNSSVYSTANGVVSSVEYSSFGYGNNVTIDHLNGYKTLYAHLDTILIPVGSFVGKNDLIARSGNTGRSTGPHLHYEITLNEITVDPSNFIRM